MLRKEMEHFERNFPDGVYAIPREKDAPKVKVRALFDFCQKHGIAPEELTSTQMEPFIENDN